MMGCQSSDIGNPYLLQESSFLLAVSEDGGISYCCETFRRKLKPKLRPMAAVRVVSLVKSCILTVDMSAVVF